MSVCKLPSGLERVFSVGHQYADRIVYDVVAGQYYDLATDFYLDASDLPAFGLAPRESAPLVAVHPAGWEVDTVTKYGIRCLRWSRHIDGVWFYIEQRADLSKGSPDPVGFALYRWSDVVGSVCIGSSSSAVELAKRAS